MRCSSLPERERPRERLFRLGPESLGLQELLAILLRTGTKAQDVLELSGSIMGQFGNLAGLLRASPEEFLGIPGCGSAKASLLAATMEIARRAMEEVAPASLPEDSWEARIGFLARRNRYEEREFLWAFFLDGSEKVLGEERLSYGGLEGACLDLPLFLRKAVRLGAEEVILLHNHPRGSTEPSREDLELTKYVADRLRVLEMRLKAHYILGNGMYERIMWSEA